jgi:hypothetical protein
MIRFPAKDSTTTVCARIREFRRDNSFERGSRRGGIQATRLFVEALDRLDLFFTSQLGFANGRFEN